MDHPTAPALHVPDAPVRGHRPFHVLRHIALAGLVGIVAVTACLFAVYRQISLSQLVEHEGRANADRTRMLSNTIWQHHRAMLVGPGGRSREQLLAEPDLPSLHADVTSSMQGMQVHKVKIYDLHGLTVYSSDPRQIGESKATNEGFRAAHDGHISSAITFRDSFDAFEGVVNNRNLIASYVPVRNPATQRVEGVVEVYSDVTDLVSAKTRAQWQVAGMVGLLLALFYAFLIAVARRADRIIAAQAQERTMREAQVRHQAFHDALTGLPNRAYFTQRLGEAIALAERHRHSCALMFIDLDRFKIVNDSLGHTAGDALLQEIAERVRACLRSTDLLFRMGGDEFTVILPQVTSPEDGAYVAARVIEAVARPVALHGHELTVGASIGLAVYPGDGQQAEELLKNADAAMYSAKQAGRGAYAFYRAEMNERALVRLDTEAALKAGFRDGEFTLHYQPRLDAGTRRVVAVEALLRWARPGHGMVPPGEFVGLLEELGMMGMVGEWVMRRACTQVRQLHEAGFAELRVSVNVSSVQFSHPDFLGVVERVLADTGLAPHLLELELTESTLIANTAQARKTILDLKGIGVRVALDDFGTGYSSLNYLRHFPVDFLKIDRCFVTEIVSNARDRLVATAIIELATALRMSVVAEGVETDAQAKVLTDARVSELQGYLFSKPLSPRQLLQFLATDWRQHAEAVDTVAA